MRFAAAVVGTRHSVLSCWFVPVSPSAKGPVSNSFQIKGGVIGSDLIKRPQSVWSFLTQEILVKYWKNLRTNIAFFYNGSRNHNSRSHDADS